MRVDRGRRRGATTATCGEQSRRGGGLAVRGLQILGHSFPAGDRQVGGLGLLDADNYRLPTRAVGLLTDDPDLAYVTHGYENHACGTGLGWTPPAALSSAVSATETSTMGPGDRSPPPSARTGVRRNIGWQTGCWNRSSAARPAAISTVRRTTPHRADPRPGAGGPTARPATGWSNRFPARRDDVRPSQQGSHRSRIDSLRRRGRVGDGCQRRRQAVWSAAARWNAPRLGATRNGQCVVVEAAV